MSDIEHGRLTSPADREKRLSGALTDFDEPEGKNGPVVLFSPVNVGVDLEREIPITTIARSSHRRNLKELREYINASYAKDILARFKKGVRNADTGFVVTMSKTDFSEHLKSDDKSINIMEQLEAVRALPELMERAVLVESYKDAYSRPEVLNVHRFYAPLRIGDALYTVKLTVNEFIDGYFSVDFPSSLKLYHHRLEKEIPSGNLPGLLGTKATTGPTEGISKIRLHELIKDVKDNDGEIFVQHDMTDHDEWQAITDERSLRGNILSRVYDRAAGAMTSRNDRYTIQLFRRANLSTLSHELMHAVHLDMERLEREGQGTPEFSRDLDVLRSWTAVMDDDVRLKKEYDRYQKHLFGGKPFEELSPEERRVSRETAKEEMTARGFEQYLREGVAPSRGLEGVFRRFRRWLMEVYREARALDVDLTGEVRDLFDRMLTAEEQVRDTAGAWHIPTGAKKLPDALPLTDAERRAVLMLSEDAQARAVDTLIQEERDDRTRKDRSTERTVTLLSQDNSLSARFADMPMIEADSSRFFGPGKAIDGDGRNMRKAIKDWAKMNFPEEARYENADTGMKNIQITPKGVKDTLSHGYDELLARSVPFIPQIIKSGLLLASIEKKPGLMSHIFAGKIRLDGQDYVVGFVLRVDNNGNRFYDHELTKIIDPGWLYRDPLSFKETSYTGPANRGDVMNLLRDKLGVNDGTGKIRFQTWKNHGEDRAASLFGIDVAFSDFSGRRGYTVEDALFEARELLRMEELFGTAISRRLLVGVMSDEALDRGEDDAAQDDELRLWAERILDAKSAEENVRPEPYRFAAGRAMREERDAMEKEEWSRAWRANVRARVNLELARLSAERRGMMEQMEKESESLLDSESADAETRLAVFLLSQRMGLVRPTLKMVNKLKGGSSGDLRRALDGIGRAGTYDAPSSGRKWRRAPWARLTPDLDAMKKLLAREGVAA